MITTLNSLLKEHPEWGDLPIVVPSENGGIDFIGAAGLVYMVELLEEDGGGNGIMFAPN